MYFNDYKHNQESGLGMMRGWYPAPALLPAQMKKKEA